MRGVARALGRAAVDRRLLDRPGRKDLSRRQPSHEAVPVLGMADRRAQAGPSGRDPSLGSLHAAEGDVPAGEVGLQPVVHILRLAQHELGAESVLHRAAVIAQLVLRQAKYVYDWLKP